MFKGIDFSCQSNDAVARTPIQLYPIHLSYLEKTSLKITSREKLLIVTPLIIQNVKQ